MAMAVLLACILLRSTTVKVMFRMRRGWRACCQSRGGILKGAGVSRIQGASLLRATAQEVQITTSGFLANRLRSFFSDTLAIAF
jgi:hypothetical protein